MVCCSWFVCIGWCLLCFDKLWSGCVLLVWLLQAAGSLHGGWFGVGFDCLCSMLFVGVYCWVVCGWLFCVGWWGWCFGFACFLVFCELVVGFCYGGLMVLLLCDVVSSGVLGVNIACFDCWF